MEAEQSALEKLVFAVESQIVLGKEPIHPVTGWKVSPTDRLDYRDALRKLDPHSPFLRDLVALKPFDPKIPKLDTQNRYNDLTNRLGGVSTLCSQTHFDGPRLSLDYVDGWLRKIGLIFSPQWAVDISDAVGKVSGLVWNLALPLNLIVRGTVYISGADYKQVTRDGDCTSFITKMLLLNDPQMFQKLPLNFTGQDAFPVDDAASAWLLEKSNGVHIDRLLAMESIGLRVARCHKLFTSSLSTYVTDSPVVGIDIMPNEIGDDYFDPEALLHSKRVFWPYSVSQPVEEKPRRVLATIQQIQWKTRCSGHVEPYAITQVGKLSLGTMGFVLRYRLGIGSKVWHEKGCGYVVAVADSAGILRLPPVCPLCDSPLMVETIAPKGQSVHDHRDWKPDPKTIGLDGHFHRLQCDNPECPRHFALKLSKFLKGIRSNVYSLEEIESLVNEGVFKEYVDVFTVGAGKLGPVVGLKRSSEITARFWGVNDNLSCHEIHKKVTEARRKFKIQITMSEFLQALGVANQKQSARLSKMFGSIGKLTAATTEEIWKRSWKLYELICSIQKFLQRPEIVMLMTFFQFETEELDSVRGQIFFIPTASVHRCHHLIRLISDRHGSVSSFLTNEVDWALETDAEEFNRYARNMGIPLISEKDLETMLQAGYNTCSQ